MAGPIELYLIRHGIAEDRGPEWPDDAKRPLTEKGISRLKKSARGLRTLGVAFEVVLTSPLVRARQTAEAIATSFEERPSIVNADSLAPGASYQGLLDDLAKQANSPPALPARAMPSSSRRAPCAASMSKRCRRPGLERSSGS